MVRTLGATLPPMDHNDKDKAVEIMEQARDVIRELREATLKALDVLSCLQAELENES